MSFFLLHQHEYIAVQTF